LKELACSAILPAMMAFFVRSGGNVLGKASVFAALTGVFQGIPSVAQRD
jgi:hypothetical protein